MRRFNEAEVVDHHVTVGTDTVRKVTGIEPHKAALSLIMLAIHCADCYTPNKNICENVLRMVLAN